jgi:hypothetical protein
MAMIKDEQGHPRTKRESGAWMTSATTRDLRAPRLPSMNTNLGHNHAQYYEIHYLLLMSTLRTE